MSGVSPSYGLPVNLRLTTSPPAFSSSTPKEVASAFDELYVVLNNMARALVTLNGAAPRNAAEWSQLAGLASTILASNMGRLYVYAAETLAYGDIISLTNVAGQLQARLANATDNTKPADGFCNTVDGITIGTVGEVVLGHGVLPASGLTVAQRYYLSTTDGVMSTTPAVAAGNIEQYLGVAISDEALYFNCGYWIQH